MIDFTSNMIGTGDVALARATAGEPRSAGSGAKGRVRHAVGRWRVVLAVVVGVPAILAAAAVYDDQYNDHDANRYGGPVTEQVDP